MVDLLKQIAASRGNAKREVADVVHGTTLVTNTLIERKGARTGLVVTEGTRDVLTIAREIRYDLYDLNLEIPQPLVTESNRVEAAERLDVSGAVVKPLTDGELNRVLDALGDLNVEAVAVCFLHAYVNDVHEQQVAAAVKKRFPQMAISISSGIAREIREFERMSTTVANAYVQPLVTEYLNRLDQRVHELAPGAPLKIMISSGGFTSGKAAAETPILLLESGPAGGVLSEIGRAHV